MDFAHVGVWIFDLDNTLYPPSMALFPQIEARMTAYVMRALSVEHDHADRLRHDYWSRHGTTLAGLMAEHAIDGTAYLNEVHDIDFGLLRPDPALAAAIAALPGRKLVHTNGDSRYAAKVLAARGLTMFEAVYGVEETGFHPKPDARAFHAVLDHAGVDPRKAAFFEDDPRNLRVPHDLGMRTVLVTPDTGTRPAHVDAVTDDLTVFLTAL